MEKAKRGKKKIVLSNWKRFATVTAAFLVAVSTASYAVGYAKSDEAIYSRAMKRINNSVYNVIQWGDGYSIHHYLDEPTFHFGQIDEKEFDSESGKRESAVYLNELVEKEYNNKYSDHDFDEDREFVMNYHEENYELNEEKEGIKR